MRVMIFVLTQVILPLRAMKFIFKNMNLGDTLVPLALGMTLGQSPTPHFRVILTQPQRVDPGRISGLQRVRSFKDGLRRQVQDDMGSMNIVR